MASLGIRGNENTPIPANEVLLDSSLHLQLEVKAKAGIYRMHCNDQWKTKSEDFGHERVTVDMEREHLLRMGMLE
jgi:hypothetical protein